MFLVTKIICLQNYYSVTYNNTNSYKLQVCLLMKSKLILFLSLINLSRGLYKLTIHTKLPTFCKCLSFINENVLIITSVKSSEF
jgi:hypothetical protein